MANPQGFLQKAKIQASHSKNSKSTLKKKWKILLLITVILTIQGEASLVPSTTTALILRPSSRLSTPTVGAL